MTKPSSPGVTAYLASQLGFSEFGRQTLEELVKPGLREIGITVYDPFQECGKELDLAHVESLRGFEERRAYWWRFNGRLAAINEELLEKSDCLLALLDGGHAVDDGVASEIGFFAGRGRGPVFALRTDLRGGENIAASINPQLLAFIVRSGGVLVEGPDGFRRWLAVISEWASRS